MKKAGITNIFIILFITSIFLVFPVYGESVNIIKNPGFEDVSDGKPADWDPKGNLPPGVEFEVVETGAHSGLKCFKITNTDAYDNMWVQKVKIQKGKLYRVSAWIQAENIRNKPGSPNITLYYVSNSVGCKGIYTSKELNDTGGQWANLTFYIKTRKDIDDPLTLGIRLGGQGTDNQGTAYFDDISVEESENIGPGIDIFDFNTSIINSNGGISNNSGSKSGSNTGNQNNASPANNDGNNFIASNGKTLLYLMIGIAVLGLLVFAEYKVSKLHKKDKAASDDTDENENTAEDKGDEENK